MINGFSKKSAIIFFVILILFSALPKPVFALGGAGDTTFAFETNPVLLKAALVISGATVTGTGSTLINTAKGIINTASTLINTSTGISGLAQKFLEWAFKLAVEALKRKLLDMIVDQIVVWIQGGGEPKFITDWPGFFRDAVDQAGGDFLKELKLGLFCSPYNLKLRAAFIPIPRFADRSACTLTQIGVNIDNFLKDFNKGGWVAWNEMVLKPQNNIYGAYLMAWDEQEKRKSAAAKAAGAEAQAGRGFLSVKRCAISHVEPGIPPDETGEALPPTTVCDRYEIVTPGKVVGDAAAEIIGADIKLLVNSQDLSAYISAIANAILNRVFAEGVGLLRAAVSTSGGGGGGGGGGGSATSQCVALLGTAAYTQCVNSIQSGQNISIFQKSYLIQTIDQDLTFQNQLFGAKQATLTVLNQSLNVLERLEVCRNLPNPETANVRSAISTITNDIASIQSDIIALQLKQQQVKNETDLSKISDLYAQIAQVVVPGTTQSFVIAAQAETSKRQESLSVYQQQLTVCGGTSVPLYSINARPTNVAAGGEVFADWIAPLEHGLQNWIGIYRVGDPDSEYITLLHVDLGSSGTLQFSAPLAAGTYNFRYFDNDTSLNRLATSNTFTVQ